MILSFLQRADSEMHAHKYKHTTYTHTHTHTHTIDGIYGISNANAGIPTYMHTFTLMQ